MPLIYGEGRKAFMRLQFEILRKLDDDSIYAWSAEHGLCRLLALWPTALPNSGNIIQFTLPDDKMPWLPPTMTSLGLELKSRYARHDPYQKAIDVQHGVRSIHTSIATEDATSMVMYCGPCESNDLPITKAWTSQRRSRALVILLERFGATW